MLSSIRENEGEITVASDLLQELQVETFGSMEKREKVDFILEQMRLLKVQGDWDKVGIVSKRINMKWLAEAEHEVGVRSTLLHNDRTDASIQDLKLRFYALMISYGIQTQKYLDVCKYYRQVYDCPSIASDDAKWPAVLRNVCYFVILAPYDNEQSDLLARVFKDEKLVKLVEIQWVVCSTLA